jgi:hypothetical protein
MDQPLHKSTCSKKRNIWTSFFTPTHALKTHYMNQPLHKSTCSKKRNIWTSFFTPTHALKTHYMNQPLHKSTCSKKRNIWTCCFTWKRAFNYFFFNLAGLTWLQYDLEKSLNISYRYYLFLKICSVGNKNQCRITGSATPIPTFWQQRFPFFSNNSSYIVLWLPFAELNLR